MQTFYEEFGGKMRCLIIDEIHPVLIEILEKGGVEVEYLPKLTKSEIELKLSSFEILVLRSKFFLDRQFLNRATTLKIIARAGAGLDIVDVEAAHEFGIEVIHAAEGNADAVGEHTIGMILMALNKMAEANFSVKSGNWNREAFRGVELNTKVVGLLGYGNMGQAVAKRLQSFGCKVISYDKYLENWPDQNAISVPLKTLQMESDILSIHLPLTNETNGWINKNFLRQCKKGLILVNTARGPIVPIDDLLELLHDESIRFAALDVLETEPPFENDKKNFQKYEALFSKKNVLVTPHVAGWTIESYEKISSILALKILHLLDDLRD